MASSVHPMHASSLGLIGTPEQDARRADPEAFVRYTGTPISFSALSRISGDPPGSGADAALVLGDLAPDALVDEFALLRQWTQGTVSGSSKANGPLAHAPEVGSAQARTAAKRRNPSQMLKARIPTADGVKLSAEVRYAASPEPPKGTVVFVHGFCGDKGENGLFDALASLASLSGFQTVSYDWRGLAESEGVFPTSTLKDHTDDFRQVTEWVRASLGDESSPLYAVGFSLGAAVVGLALRKYGGIDGVTYLSPAVRPRISMWPRYDSVAIRREIRLRGRVKKPGSKVLLGQPILESLRDTDLGQDAFDLDVPLLVCHGTADSRIDCAHTQELVARTQELLSDGAVAKRFGYLQLEGASHSFRPEERCWQLVAAAVTRWFTECDAAPRSRERDGLERAA